MSVIECSWQIPYSISGIKIELLSTQSLLRIWTYWVLNDSIEKMQLLSTQFQLRIWTYWVLNIEYSISTTFLGAIEYSINPILSEHYHMKGDPNLKQKETFRRPIIAQKETF